MARPYIYELSLPDFLGLNEDDVQGVLVRLNNTLRVPHLRLLSYVNVVSPEDFEMARRGHMARQRHTFGRGYMEQEVRMLSSYLRRVPAWSMRHYLVVWGRPLQAMGDWLVEAHPPEPLADDYDETPRYLKPCSPGGHFVKIIASYEFRRGRWEWDHPWASLMALADGPLILCLDAVRISEDKIRLVRQGLQNTQKINPDDPDAQMLASLSNQALQSGEEFYEMRLFMLLSDSRLERLEVRAERLQQTYDALLGLTALEGSQGAALEFFGSKERPVLGTHAHSFVLGSALPVAFGGLAGMVNKIHPEGVYFGFRNGMGAQPLGPLHWELWTESNRAGHMGFLGMTGSGKTVSMSALLARFRAMAGASIVLIEPMGNAARLAHLLERDPGMCFHRLEWSDLQLNPLDWIAESADLGQGMSEQESHVKAMLQVMLNRPLNNLEEGFMAKALKRLYASLTLEQLDDLRYTPRLEAFCQGLSDLKKEPYGHEADRLAVEIAGKYVQGGFARIFNQPTNLPLSYDGAHLFDAAAVAGTDTGNRDFQTILYYALFSHFMRVARRDKQAGKKVRRIIAIDEYYALSRNPYLKTRLDFMVRTLRNLYTNLWVAEQTLSTFAGDEDASLIANIPFWLVFRQGMREASLVPQQFGARCPAAYALLMPTFQQGQCVAMLDQTSLLSMNLLGLEYDALVKN